MNKIETVIYVEPTAKARPRFAIIKGRVRTYTPAKTRRAEADIKAMIRLQVMELGSFGADVPLRLEVTFYRDRPKHLPKRVMMPMSRPDYDNYAKLLTDALEKFIYPNDSQICTALIKKRFGRPPRIELTIEIDKEVENGKQS